MKTCEECGREMLHEPGEYLVVNVLRNEMFPKMLVAYVYNPADPAQLPCENVHAFTQGGIEQKIHDALPGRSLHWHWPGDTIAEKRQTFA